MRISSDQISLKDAVCFVVDNRGKTAPTAEQGHALIATNCISNDDLYPTYKNVRYVSEETFQNWFRAHPKPGDIILTNKGSQNGAICLVPEVVDFCIAQDMMALRAHPERIDSLYLFAALRSAPIQQAIKNLNVDGVIPHFKKTDFDKLVIPLPDRRIQILIGKLHFSLVEKIELNRKMNTTLESMARALFRDWFVDFGPTRAKMAGEAPYLSPTLWPLFPDRLDDEGKPEGWKVEPLGVHMVNRDSKRVPVSGGERAKRQGPFPYHGATGVMDYVDDYLFDGIYLLVGEDGSVAKENGLAFTQYVWGKLWVNNHAHVLQGKGAVSTEQLLMHFQHELVTPYITGAVQLKLSQGRMNAMPFMYAGPKVCESFAKLVAPFFEKLRANADENKTLAQTRDLLLPRLMSGELRVQDLPASMEGEI